jgi:hypothetical protein
LAAGCDLSALHGVAWFLTRSEAEAMSLAFFLSRMQCGSHIDLDFQHPKMLSVFPMKISGAAPTDG